jgi:glycine oxidase
MTKVEFFIIGQGLAGTLLAFEMMQNNIDFRIVSTSQKSKSSLVAAGMINPLVFKRLTKSWLLDDLLPVMQDTYSNLEYILEEKFLHKKNILKPLSEQEKHLWLERKANPYFTDYILSVNDNINLKTIQKAYAYGKIGGSGYLDLKLFLNSAEKYFRAKNLVIDSTFDFMQDLQSDNSYKVRNCAASKIVFCEGQHVTENPFFSFIKMSRTKGEVLLIHAPDLSEEYILNKKVFVLPVGSKRFKVGSTYDWKDLTERTTQKGKESILERLDELISVDYKIEEHYAGIRPTVIDRRPILGVHPSLNKMYIFNGLGTKGVMLAPYFAKQMIHILQDKDYRIHKEIDVSRFWKD